MSAQQQMPEGPVDKVVSRDAKTVSPTASVYGYQLKPEEPIDKGEAAESGSRLQVQSHTAELLSKRCQPGSIQHLALIQKHLLCYG